MSIPFVKMQGIGNDFVVVDARELGSLNWQELAIHCCDRHNGVGADGLLTIGTADNSAGAMRMFNPDGTEDFCGNGLRCVARRLIDLNPELGTRVFTIDTIAGRRTASVSGNGDVTVTMGRATFDPLEVPHVLTVDNCNPPSVTVDSEMGRFTGWSLSTGTAHFVIPMIQLAEDADFDSVSHSIEIHPGFPKRTSVMWTRVDPDGGLTLRIWERGAGETWGCGSGACAAAVVMMQTERVRGPVPVRSRGGTLLIDQKPDGEIVMSGPAEVVYIGTLP